MLFLFVSEKEFGIVRARDVDDALRQLEVWRVGDVKLYDVEECLRNAGTMIFKRCDLGSEQKLYKR